MKNFARAALGQGLALGFGDEIEARLRSIGPQDYGTLVNQIREQNRQYYQDSPKTALAAEVAGGIVPTALAYFSPAAPVAGARSVGVLNKIRQAYQAQKDAQAARTLPQTIGRAAVAGGSSGAIAGAGAAEGNLVERLPYAATGAAIGAPLAAGMPVVGLAGNSLFRRLAEIYPSDERAEAAAARHIYRNLGKDVQPTDLNYLMEMDRRLDADSMLANASPRLTAQAEMLAARSGDSSEIIEDAFTRQLRGARGNVQRTVDANLGDKNFFTEQDRMVSEMRQNAAPLYRAAYDVGEVTDPEVLKFIQGALNPDVGPPTLISRYPQFTEAANEVRRLAAAEGKILDLNVPTVENLDHIKRGLDSLIEKEIDSFGKVSPLGKVYIEQKNNFLNALDIAVPEYGTARRVYAGDAEVKKALERGYKEFDELRGPQIEKMVQNMSDAEKEAFKSGVSSRLYYDINTPDQDRNFARMFANSPNMLEKLKPLFENPLEFDVFNAAMKRQSEIFQQTARAVRGSPTARRQAAVESFENDPYANAILSLGADASLGNMVLRFFQNTKVSDPVAKRMAEMLTAGTPEEVAAVVTALENYGSARVARTWAADQMSDAASTAARNLIIENYDTSQMMPEDRTQESLNRAQQLLGEPKEPSLDELLERASRLID